MVHGQGPVSVSIAAVLTGQHTHLSARRGQRGELPR